jgi:hypothetical protein
MKYKVEGSEVQVNRVQRFRVHGSELKDFGFSLFAGLRSGRRDRRQKLLESLSSLKNLWERFSTAIDSLGQISVIVVKNHSHQALTSTEL